MAGARLPQGSAGPANPLGRRRFSEGGKPGHGALFIPGIQMPASAWSLHSRLKEDTIDIGDLPLSRVLVIKDAHYPWLLLVPRRDGAVEIIDLDEVEQAQLMAEVSRVARALKEVTQCDKLNTAALEILFNYVHVLL